jgi:hypothetical protein
VFDVHYDGSQFVVTQIGTFPAQPEDGIFVTADLIQNPGARARDLCAHAGGPGGGGLGDTASPAHERLRLASRSARRGGAPDDDGR